MKTNFDTSLRFQKVLEFLNELNEHKIGTGEEYFLCKVNEEVKNILSKLGVDTRKLGYYDEKDGVDILEIWGQIARHYDQDIFYNGNSFIVWNRNNKKAQSELAGIIADYEGQQYERPGDEVPVAQILVELKTVYEILAGGSDDRNQTA